MVKKICISVSDYVNKHYLSTYRGNKSKFIEEMFLVGVSAESGELANKQTQIIELAKKCKELEEENRKYKMQLGNYAQKFNKKLDHAGVSSEDELKQRDQDIAMIKGLQRARWQQTPGRS